MTRGIILAAGRGSRMLRHTENQPKCLLKLRGISLLERQFSVFKANGIDKIMVVCGYLADTIPDFNDITFIKNPRWQETNMVTTLLMAANWLSHHECVVSYSDIFYSPGTMGRLLDVDADIAITYDPDWLVLWQLRFEDPLSDAETFKIDTNGHLVDIGDRTDNLTDIDGQYMGLIKFRPAGWAIAETLIARMSSEKISKIDMTSFLKIILKFHHIQTIPCTGVWGEIDTEHDLMVSEEIIAEAEK